eukprot:536981-Alexandrium_andersonii.AAC.1
MQLVRPTRHRCVQHVARARARSSWRPRWTTSGSPSRMTSSHGRPSGGLVSSMRCRMAFAIACPRPASDVTFR